MNRAIKFRGKSFDSGKWIYGFYSERNGKSYIQMDGEVILTPVDPATVGQLTGLKDKSEREIYEGDVFTVNGKYPKLVKYKEDRACFCISNTDQMCDEGWMDIWQSPNPRWWSDHSAKIEIIGNIYDNPELLKTE